MSILRPVSHAGTAPWQYVLPRKTKKAPLGPAAAFDLMVRTIFVDMQECGSVTGPPAVFIEADARTCQGVPDRSIDLVITSPPYANNYDYADATRLEMVSCARSTAGVIRNARCGNGWSDPVRSTCPKAVDLEEVLAAPEVAPDPRRPSKVCQEFGLVRQQKGGKKTYHLMVACYFLDIAQVWQALRRVCRQPARALLRARRFRPLRRLRAGD